MTVSGFAYPPASGMLYPALNHAHPSGATVCERARWHCHREDHPSGAAVCERAPWHCHREEHPSGAAVCESPLGAAAGRSVLLQKLQGNSVLLAFGCAACGSGWRCAHRPLLLGWGLPLAGLSSVLPRPPPAWRPGLLQRCVCWVLRELTKCINQETSL